jgi:MFS family permease
LTALGEAVLAPGKSTITVSAGLAVGGCLTWNISNVGAVADPLAHTYGTSLAVIGLLTTALFVTHLAAQLPSGVAADRFGARTVALASVVFVIAGNLIALTAPEVALAATGRAVAGIGSGAAFVSGLDLVRAGGGGPLAQGLFGGSTMAGGGLALMTVPALTDAAGWRTPYWTAIVLAGVAALPTIAARNVHVHARREHGPRSNLAALLPLGALQASSFGLSVVAGNWVVTLLEREGAGSTLAGIAGGLILFAGVLTRPAGGYAVRRRPELVRPAVVASIAAGVAGAAGLAAGASLWLSTAGALVLGLAAGIPFAPVFAAAVRLQPGAPAAAIGLVNGCAVLAILVGTPIAGLAFSLPGDGRIAFGVIAALWCCALLALRRTPIR